jgi:hypothetical protein
MTNRSSSASISIGKSVTIIGMHSSIGVLVMEGVGRLVGEVLEWVLVGAVVDRRWITRTSTGGTTVGTVRRSSSLRLRCSSSG